MPCMILKLNIIYHAAVVTATSRPSVISNWIHTILKILGNNKLERYFIYLLVIKLVCWLTWYSHVGQSSFCMYDVCISAQLKQSLSIKFKALRYTSSRVIMWDNYSPNYAWLRSVRILFLPPHLQTNSFHRDWTIFTMQYQNHSAPPQTNGGQSIKTASGFWKIIVYAHVKAQSHVRLFWTTKWFR